MKTRKSSRKPNKRRRSGLVPRSSQPLGTVFILKRGTLLHTGTHGSVTFPLFLTPHKALAHMYSGTTGEVISFHTTRPLTLMVKHDVLWALKRGTILREEWDGFGSEESDIPVAKALCRRRAQETSWVYPIDGWVHKYDSQTLGEVLVCDSSVLERVIP